MKRNLIVNSEPVYTAEYCKENDIVIICNTEEEYNKVKQLINCPQNLTPINSNNFPIYVYENINDSGWDNVSSRCYKDHNGNIDAPTFLLHNKKEFKIKLNKDERKSLIKLLQKF